MLALFLRTSARLVCCAAFAGALQLVSADSLAQGSDGPVVAVSGGRVQGRFLSEPGGAVFKGIPYAAPPAGDLRWRETQPVRPWTNLLQAAEFRLGCGQARPATQEGIGAAEEDCLYLNVWAPQWPARAKTAVLYWINGGELYGGSGSLRAGAESLARHGVILVSANYRGTLLGMMGHPELTAESPHHSTANYMMFDQIAVLRWIHDNIARFGGDPGNVTVFAQSGGAHTASMLLTSPQSKGLIRRAILDSGAPMQSTRPYLRLDELEQIGTVTAEVLGVPAIDTIKYLRALPASQIVAAMPTVRAKLLEMNGADYDEGTDGYVIPKSTAEVWLSHKELAVPMMIGSNGQDSELAVGQRAPLDAAASPQEAARWEKGILDIFYGQDPDLLERAQQIYGLRGGANEISTYPPYGTPVKQLGVDLNQRCGVILSAALHSVVASTWEFEFTRSTPGHAPTHGAELRYIFGYDDLTDLSDRKYADVMQQYWTNFAKTGNPNGPGLPAWSKYNDAMKPSMDFATDGPVQRLANRSVACAPYTEKYARHPTSLSSGANLRLRISAPGGR